MISYFSGNCVVANYADDNTFYSINDDTQNFRKTLETEIVVLLRWLQASTVDIISKRLIDNVHCATAS